MVATPWGDSEKLRARMLRPGVSVDRAEVERNQRERLYGAMIAVAAEKGYEATTVADLVRISGVSRSDFYEHFENKEACLLAALETIMGAVTEAVSRDFGGSAPAASSLRALMSLIAEQRAAAQVCLVEAYAAGPAAIEMVDRTTKLFEELVQRAFESRPETRGMPPAIVRAIVGGVRKVLHTRLYRDSGLEIAGLVGELRAWSLTYRPPPEPLRSPRGAGGRQPQFEGYTVAQRIARSVAAVIAEKGYVAMRTGDIAERASISLSTFYANYDNKEEAMLAAVELSGTLMLATVGPAVRRAPDWRTGVRALYESMCAFLAAEPDFARLAVSEVYAAGPRALAQRDRVIDSLLELLAPGYAERPETPSVAAEAIGGAVFALLNDQMHSGGPDSMLEVAPLLTYMTLAPFVGPEDACAVANGGV